MFICISPYIPNLKQGSIFTLSDMGSMYKGAQMQVFIREEGVVTGHLLIEDYHLSTAYTQPLWMESFILIHNVFHDVQENGAK